MTKDSKIIGEEHGDERKNTINKLRKKERKKGIM